VPQNGVLSHARGIGRTDVGSGRPHFLQDLRDGDWRIVVVCLALGALICGFFWELWNYYSFPKWIYHIPGAEFLRVFEMPLLGYGGYIPFALELYALKNLLWPDGPRLSTPSRAGSTSKDIPLFRTSARAHSAILSTIWSS